MLSIAEWADRASALFSLMTLTSSVSFSLSIRISLRLKIHQAQAKNFCRGLDIRVAKIVEANMWHIVFFQKSFEMRCEVIRFNDFSNFIYIDIVEIVCTITGTAEFPVFFLIFPHLEQDFLIGCNKRKGTAAGFCLCSVTGNNLKFTINLCLLNGMLDCNGLLFKINGIPL